ncbi:MAG: methionine synthase [bacterium (Candidatus Stahlbacteria) CG08_land_8_20_14_0_20_40_26]|nr:MAG: methionine synthase [bacterium (Candidatus Stahlbacteria) CG08_land_8_20_14_0_20_40_26]
MKSSRILGASIGKCIHVAGILNFLRLAESLGYETEFMGPAIPVKRFVSRIYEVKPDLAAVSYRLTPEAAQELFRELEQELKKQGIRGIKLIFGGTPPVAKIARATNLFEAVFSGEESPKAIVDYLKQQKRPDEKRQFAQTLVERIHQHQPFPLLRHHLGLKTVEETIEAARQIALSEELDILSIAPDQNAQEYFFRPQDMPPTESGAGGVPIRKPEDLRAIYEATRCGNFPLLRCYAGTRDLIQWAEMSVKMINMAWGAIPIFWYSELDKRSSRPLIEAIRENQETIRWYAERGIPVEVNDSHQWSLRDAHDAVAVAVAFLAAYNAKALGVKYYVSQYMLNTPPETTPVMDLAKMLAKIEMIESLHDNNFISFRQIRTGLRSMPVNPNIAKGHLAASIAFGMALRPHIVHVVSYCEANHAAGAKEIIESCQIARGVIRLGLKGFPDLTRDPEISKRKKQLVKEVNFIIEAIRNLGKEDPLVDPTVLEKAVRTGILDAPHLSGSTVAKGNVVTVPVEGRYVAINPATRKVLSEQKRLTAL